MFRSQHRPAGYVNVAGLAGGRGRGKHFVESGEGSGIRRLPSGHLPESRTARAEPAIGAESAFHALVVLVFGAVILASRRYVHDQHVSKLLDACLVVREPLRGPERVPGMRLDEIDRTERLSVAAKHEGGAFRSAPHGQVAGIVHPDSRDRPAFEPEQVGHRDLGQLRLRVAFGIRPEILGSPFGNCLMEFLREPYAAKHQVCFS